MVESLKQKAPGWTTTAVVPSRIGYAREIIKNFLAFPFLWGKEFARKKLGRRPFGNETVRLCSRHFRHLLRLRPIEHLTVSDFIGGEGAGSKALMTMFTISLCRAYGISYVHTPFTRLGHAEVGQAEWDAGWEAFFNLGLGEEDIQSRTSEAFDYFLLTYLQTSCLGNWTKFIHPPLPRSRPHYYLEIPVAEGDPLRRAYEDQFVRLLDSQLPEFKARYRHQKDEKRSQTFTICVHIRRGDIQSHRTDMWTDLSSYANCLDVISEILTQQGIQHQIQCFSQGGLEDFQDLERHNVEWHLNKDAKWTMQRLIEADVIVTAKSCFSYVAAMLSDAVVIYEPGFLPGFDHWVPRDKDGYFEPDEIKCRLATCPGKV